MGALGRDVVTTAHRRLIGRANEFAYRRAGDRFERRRCEIAGICRMQRRLFEQLVDNCDSWAGLVRAGQTIVKVKPHPIINRQLGNWTPFVLQVDAIEPLSKSMVVDDCLSSIARRNMWTRALPR